MPNNLVPFSFVLLNLPSFLLSPFSFLLFLQSNFFLSLLFLSLDPGFLLAIEVETVSSSPTNNDLYVRICTS